MEWLLIFLVVLKKKVLQGCVMEIWISSGGQKFCMQIMADFSRLFGNFIMQISCVQWDIQTYDTNRNMQTLIHCASSTIEFGESYSFRINLQVLVFTFRDIALGSFTANQCVVSVIG